MAFAVNDRWPGFGGRHGLFLLLCPLARSPLCAQPPQGAERLPDRMAASAVLSRIVLQRFILVLSPPIALGGYRPCRCQVVEKGPPVGAKRGSQPTPAWPPDGPAADTNASKTRRRPRRSGAGAAFDGAVGTVGVDVERASRALHHFARDHDLFDAFQTRKIEHGLKQDAFENRAQAPR